MAPTDDTEPVEIVLGDEVDVTIEELESDERVLEVLDQIEAYSETGEDQAVVLARAKPRRKKKKRLPPGERPPDVRKEHRDNVRPAKVREEAAPEQSIVINQPDRTLSEVAEEAGLSPAEFKKLSAGDRRARTMLAAKLVDHIDAAYATVLGGRAGAPPAAAPRGGGDPAGGASVLDALPALEADGTVVTPDSPPAALARPGAAGRDPADPGALDVLDALPAMDADGTVLGPDAPAAPLAGSVDAPDSSAPSSAGARLAAEAKRRRLLVLAVLVLVAVLVVVLALTVD